MSHHQVVEEWMGESIATLEDLLRTELTAVCVGYNPTTKSVNAGHYYQGKAGQEFFGRLCRVGLLPHDIDGYEDDVLFDCGVGFTDIVKKPTDSKDDIPRKHFAYGRSRLEKKVKQFRPKLVIFSFPGAADRYFRRKVARGFLRDERIGEAKVFVMPWEADAKSLAPLRAWVKANAPGGRAPSSRGRTQAAGNPDYSKR